MTWGEILGYCLAKPGAWQDEPWEGDVVVKVGSTARHKPAGATVAADDGVTHPVKIS